MAAGATRERAESYIGFSCEGRLTGAGPATADHTPGRGQDRGCDWTLGGIFRLHRLEIIGENGERHVRFDIATPEQAAALAASLDKAGQ
jgi:hypothetical protein